MLVVLVAFMFRYREISDIVGEIYYVEITFSPVGGYIESSTMAIRSRKYFVYPFIHNMTPNPIRLLDENVAHEMMEIFLSIRVRPRISEASAANLAERNILSFLILPYGYAGDYEHTFTYVQVSFSSSAIVVRHSGGAYGGGVIRSYNIHPTDINAQNYIEQILHQIIFGD